MEIWMIKGMAVSLGQTLIFELVFALCWMLWYKREILLVILVNILTNPVVVFSAYMIRLHWNKMLVPVVVVLEILAVVVEALIYKRFSRKIEHPWFFSIGANAFSYLLGIVISQLF